MANRKHLMLRHDVVEAVAEGRFQIYPIETIDEGIALLTGRPAGTREPDGSFPEGRSEEHTSELQSLMRISYAVFCLKKTNPRTKTQNARQQKKQPITKPKTNS